MSRQPKNTNWSWHDMCREFGEEVALELLRFQPGLGQFRHVQDGERANQRDDRAEYEHHLLILLLPTYEIHDEAPIQLEETPLWMMIEIPMLKIGPERRWMARARKELST